MLLPPPRPLPHLRGRRGVFRRASAVENAVALTFDDGPHPEHTPRILDALAAAGARATFFCVGEAIGRRPDLARRIVAEGHVLGNHSYTHPVLLLRRASVVREEIRRTHEIIRDVTGESATLFRPPYGLSGLGVPAIAREMGYDTILWSVMPRDWKNPRPTELVRLVVRACRGGGVVLLHDGGGPTRTIAEALPNLLTALRGCGYAPVTVPELRRQGERS